MKLLGSKDTHKTLVAALVGAVVALLLSPLAQALSFVVNEYLARPILSVEYVEVVPNERQIPFPAAAVQALLGSQGYRTALMRNMGTGSELMTFQGNRATLNPDEFASLKSSTERFIQGTERRLADLSSLRESLSARTPDAQVREIAARYQGAFPQLFSVAQDVEAMRSALPPMIEAEAKALRESTDIAKELFASFATSSSPTTHNGKFKVSILNRGSTDGLIRHVGELRVPGSGLSLWIKRAAPPGTAASPLSLAVPVAVMNPVLDTDRSTSVGKIDAHSMSEFWFEIDASVTSKEAAESMWRLAYDAKLTKGEIVLFDQRNNRIVHRFVPVFRTNARSVTAGIKQN